jgi:protein TonB
VAGNPQPAYPERLRAANLEGEAVVAFVVDTTGRPSTITLKSASHAEFGQAAVDALRRWRFRPAEIGGRKVRQLVEQQFDFTLAR